MTNRSAMRTSPLARVAVFLSVPELVAASLVVANGVTSVAPDKVPEPLYSQADELTVVLRLSVSAAHWFETFLVSPEAIWVVFSCIGNRPACVVVGYVTPGRRQHGRYPVGGVYREDNLTDAPAFQQHAAPEAVEESVIDEIVQAGR